MGIRVFTNCSFLKGYGCSKGDGIYYSELGRTEIVNKKCLKEKCTVKDPLEIIPGKVTNLSLKEDLEVPDPEIFLSRLLLV